MIIQRNMLWRKEQDKSLQEPINEEKILVSIMINFPIQFSLVTQSCPTLCDPVDCSMPGFPVHHQLPKLTQTRVHRISDAIQPSHPLLSPSLPAFNLSQSQGLFQGVSSSYQVAKEFQFQLQHQSSH